MLALSAHTVFSFSNDPINIRDTIRPGCKMDLSKLLDCRPCCLLKVSQIFCWLGPNMGRRERQICKESLETKTVNSEEDLPLKAIVITASSFWLTHFSSKRLAAAYVLAKTCLMVLKKTVQKSQQQHLVFFCQVLSTCCTKTRLSLILP